MKVAIMTDPDGTLFFELPDPSQQPSPTLAGLDSASVDRAKLAEETIAEKDAEIARLKGELEAKLAEEPAELSDQERFDALVDDIKSLSEEGMARLAEATGWIYNAPVVEEKAPETPATPETSVFKPKWHVVVKS